MGLTGAEVVYAAKKAAAWNTAVALGAGNGFRGLAATVDPSQGLNTDDSLGQLFAVDATPGQTKLDVTIPAYARYNDAVVLGFLAAIFGTAAAPVAHAGGAASYDHTLKFAKQVDGIFFTFGALLGDAFVDEVPSLKISKVVITWETGKATQFTFTGPGVDRITDSEINTVASFNNVTVLETANRVYMAQTAIRMNNQGDAALDAGDKINPSKIVLTLERKLTGQYGTYVSGGEAPRDLIDEPTNDGMFTGTLDLTFPRLTGNDGTLDLAGNVDKKAEIICTGPIIEGAVPFMMKFQMPHLKPSDEKHQHKQGQIDNTRSYQVMGAVAAPAGMDGNTDPCWCMLTNKINAALL